MTYEQLLHEAESLPREQQLKLIERLAAHLREGNETAIPERPRWEDLIGSAAYPLCGEDAQAWVSRTRQESDEGRNVA